VALYTLSRGTAVSSDVNPRGLRGVGRPATADNVRERILDATLRQLEATGSPESVTIASVVAEAGCTPPSLYHYWPTRDRLLEEASRRGWAGFRASQSGAVADERDPVRRLRSRARAYLDFALARPALFRVLFLTAPAQGVELPPAGLDDTIRSANTNALDDLVADVSAAVAVGALRADDPFVAALALWSAMHGVAALWAVSPDLPTPLARTVARVAQDAILRGLGGTVGASIPEAG
jgi:AcrR family transcriptional regulator